MEKLLIYAALGVAYWAYKAFFKNFGTSAATKSPGPLVSPEPYRAPEREYRNLPSPQGNVPGSSIFDLLEEIKKQENQAPKAKEEPKKYFTLEDTDYEAQKIKAPIEDVNPYAYAPKKISISPTGIGEMGDPSLHRKPNPLLAVLKDKNRVKEAFIVGEILAKRY